MGETKRYSSEKEPLTSYLKRVWSYRGLILLLAKRDIQIQYAQTIFGLLWSLAQPLLAIIIYSVFFYLILGINTGDTPYPLFVLPGIICWFHFSKIVVEVGGSLNAQQEVIKKVEFPRLVVILSKVVSGLLEVAISLVLFVVVALIFKLKMTLAILAFPLFLFLNILVGLSIAIWLSTLTIRFKDLQHIIPYFINFGIWITPVFYPSTIVPEKYASVLYFNPVAGVLDGYRWALLGAELPSLNFAYSILFSVLLFLVGLLVFVRKEPEIADFI